MEILIDQSAGFGDIFFCQKIAIKLMEFGHTVYWKVFNEYQYIEEYIRNGIIWQVDDNKISKIRTLNLDHCTRYFTFSSGEELGHSVMQTKYRYANDQFSVGGWEDWQNYFKIIRDYEREKVLENIVLEGVPNEFSLICNHFATDYQILAYLGGGSPIISEVKYPIVEIIKIPGMRLFDWCGVFEKASEIRIPDSSFPYLVEILKTTDDIHMYSRNHEGSIRTKPIWKRNWHFIDKWELKRK